MTRKRRSALCIAGAVAVLLHAPAPATSVVFAAPVVGRATERRHVDAFRRKRLQFGILPRVVLEHDVRGARAGPENGEEVKLSSVSQSTVNLVKNIVGAGMLSLPAGVAGFSGSSKAVIPAVALVLLFGLMSAYGFVLIADACTTSGRTTYEDAWADLVSPGSKSLISLACIANALVGCICFSMILGDCLSLILSPMGLPAAFIGKGPCLVALTVAVLLPLCCMKSLAPLAKFSAVGVASNVYIAFFIVLRCFDGSYGAGGALLKAAPLAPRFVLHTGSALSTALCSQVTGLLGILGTAFLAHFNAGIFYNSLAPDSAGGRGGPFLRMSVIGYSSAAIIYSIVMAGGFLTFGASSAGLILNNYAATDALATFARIAILVSLITSYPIVFFCVREQFTGVLGDAGETFAADRPNLLTTLLLGAITATALKLTDLSKVAGFAGATFGIFLIYIAPPLMALCSHRRGLGKPSGKLARLFQVLLIPLGGVLGAISAAQCLS